MKQTEAYKELQRRNKIFVNGLKSKPTKAEKILQKWFNENGVHHVFQKGFLLPFHRIVDFYIPRPHYLIIEVDGGVHEKLILKDNYKDESFSRFRGMQTIRIKNEEIYDESFKEKLKFLCKR